MALNLLDVNNDCLFGIFEYLTVPELADVASTCTRFRSVARDVFSHHHKPNCVTINLEYRSRGRQSAAILRHFGDLLTNLAVRFESEKEARFRNAFVFNMMVMYCTEPIERLELTYCRYLQRDTVINARALFGNVKGLKLFCSFGIDSSFLADAKELTRLDIFDQRFASVGKFLRINNYPKLQSLALNNELKGPAKADITQFLQRHTNIIELELTGPGIYDMSSIAECCPSLRKLTVWDCKPSDVAAISHLDKLTALKLPISSYTLLENTGQAIMKMLQATKSSQSLEELVLSRFYRSGREMTTVLERFINLKQLSIGFGSDVNGEFLSGLRLLEKLRALSLHMYSPCITSVALVDLVCHLPYLEQLCLNLSTQRIRLKKATYLRISEIYQNRNQKLMIYNFDATNQMEKKMKEPFAGLGQQEFVQYIALNDVGADDIIFVV